MFFRSRAPSIYPLPGILRDSDYRLRKNKFDNALFLKVRESLLILPNAICPWSVYPSYTSVSPPTLTLRLCIPLRQPPFLRPPACMQNEGISGKKNNVKDGVRYAAPELIEGNTASPTKSSDAFSFGMLILECINEVSYG